MHPNAPATSLRTGAQLLLAGWGWVALAATALPDGHPLRIALSFGFLLLGPGLAIVRLLPVKAGLERWLLAVALGMALSALVSTAFVPFGVRSASGTIAVLAVATTVAAVAPWAASRVRRRSNRVGAEAV